MTEPAFHPRAILAALATHRVDFVVIGGVAGNLHGTVWSTYDLDICYERTNENLDRLVVALTALNARLRNYPEDLPFALDRTTLKLGDSFTFATDHGDFDCLGTPSGSSGYPGLASAAVRMEIGGFQVLVASLEDLIAMKRAAGRAKDLGHLEELGGLRDEIEGIPDDWVWKSGGDDAEAQT